MAESKLREQSMDFAVPIINLVEKLKLKKIISNHPLRPKRTNSFFPDCPKNPTDEKFVRMNEFFNHQSPIYGEKLCFSTKLMPYLVADLTKIMSEKSHKCRQKNRKKQSKRKK